MRILITGGAGFVGSCLALAFKNDACGDKVVVLDNLRRRGSELNLPKLKQHGIEFVHGDIRVPSDLEELEGNFDLFIEASAEPSVLAGIGGSPRYVLETNLGGTLNCLEFARKRAPNMIFLSTSRVYPIEGLKNLPLQESATRFELGDSKVPGASARGIAESFPLDGARSIYGATKLSSELILQEYVHSQGVKALINRCGVIAGPGQFGKADQGVFTLWVVNHYFKRVLKYTGFGGTGKQVRDLLHPADLFALLKQQIARTNAWNGEVYNAGGGRDISVSLLEMSELCREATGNALKIEGVASSASVDVPLYISDYSKAAQAFGWKPARTPQQIVREIAEWLRANEAQLSALFS